MIHFIDMEVNLLSVFNILKGRVGNGKYYQSKYLEFLCLFNREERYTIQGFIEKYENAYQERNYKDNENNANNQNSKDEQNTCKKKLIGIIESIFRKKNKNKEKSPNAIDVINSLNDIEVNVIKRFIVWIGTLPNKKWKLRVHGFWYSLTNKFRRKSKSTKEWKNWIETNLLNIDDEYNMELKRCKEQQKYFSQNANEAKKKYYRIQIIIIILAFLASMILLFDGLDRLSFYIGCRDSCFYWEFENVNVSKILTGFFSGLIIVLSGIDKLKQYVQEWTKNRIASEALKREKNLYEQHSGVYDISDSEKRKKLFVANYEDIIARDVAAFESNKDKIPSELEKILEKFEQQKDNNDNVIKD